MRRLVLHKIKLHKYFNSHTNILIEKIYNKHFIIDFLNKNVPIKYNYI